MSDTDQLNAQFVIKKKQLCFTTTSEVLSHAMLQNAENQISSELSVHHFDLAPKTASSLERCVNIPANGPFNCVPLKLDGCIFSRDQ